MGKDVIAGKAPVSHEDGEGAIKTAVYKLAESGKFVFEPAACGLEGGRVLWIVCNVKFAAVRGNEGILRHKPLCLESEIKLPEDVPESFREELCPLPDEGGSRRDLIRKEIKIFQQFMADAAAFHAEEEVD